MKDVNKMIIMGRLGADPIQRETKNGLTVVHFSVATSRKLKFDPEAGEDAKTEETQWHHVVAWGKTADACALYLKKGQAVFVEGMVKCRKFEAKDGSEKVSFELHAENVSFLGSAKIPSVESLAASA